MLGQLKALGVKIRVNRGRLEVSDLSRVPAGFAEEAREWIKANRRGIIRTLTRKAPHPAAVTPGMTKNWKQARKWILPHLEELQAHGWTRANLFRAGRLSYPHGPWGIAWHSAWTRPTVRVAIGTRGEIIFSWTETNGHPIQQTARP